MTQLGLPIVLHPDLLDEIVEEVEQERVRQDAKWGEQNHRLFSSTANRSSSDTSQYAFLERSFKKFNDEAVANGTLGWDTVLLEELYEALAKAGVDDVEYEKELIETAAVCIAMVEANRRKRRGGSS